MDAVAFVTGGQQEDAIPQGFETRWRRTVRGREIEYQSIGPYASFGQANDPHRDSRHVRIGVTITSPTKCVFKTVVTTEYSRGASRESFGDATSEVTTLDFNKVRRFDIEEGDSPNMVIEGTGWMCKQGAHVKTPSRSQFQRPGRKRWRARSRASGAPSISSRRPALECLARREHSAKRTPRNMTRCRFAGESRAILLGHRTTKPASAHAQRAITSFM